MVVTSNRLDSSISESSISAMSELDIDPKEVVRQKLKKESKKMKKPNRNTTGGEMIKQTSKTKAIGKELFVSRKIQSSDQKPSQDNIGKCRMKPSVAPDDVSNSDSYSESNDISSISHTSNNNDPSVQVKSNDECLSKCGIIFKIHETRKQFSPAKRVPGRVLSNQSISQISK